MLSKIIQFVNPVKFARPGKIASGTILLGKQLFNWVKKNQADIILLIGVILISLLSFALGYITAKKAEKEPIQFETINPVREFVSNRVNKI